ncbi:MAG: hypothetical protein ABJO30_13315 [Hyphomicrobiales bacterium]
MVRTDDVVLHGSPFKPEINQTLIRAKRRELTVLLLMQPSTNMKDYLFRGHSNSTTIREGQQQ